MKALILLSLFIGQSAFAGRCDNRTLAPICHNGNHQNQGNARLNFVDQCPDFASLWGHFSNHDLDRYGTCASQVREGEVYVCNAGLKHVGPMAAGLDFFKFESTFIQDSVENVDYPFGFTSNVKVAGKNDFNEATDVIKNFYIQDKTLSFNFGSENFGTEYFVDLCWKNTSVGGIGAYDFDWSYKYEDIGTPGRSYVDMANIKTNTELLCESSSSPMGLEVFADSGNPLPFFGKEIFGSEVAVEDASFCVLRMNFKEDTTALRDWHRKDITVHSNLDVVPSDGVQAQNKIQICHVMNFSIGIGNQGGSNGNGGGQGNGNGNGNGTNSGTDSEYYECNMEFEDSDDYKRFVLEHTSSNDFSVRHNKDYRGLCDTPTDKLTCYNKLLEFEGNNIHELNHLWRTLK